MVYGGGVTGAGSQPLLWPLLIYLSTVNDTPTGLGIEFEPVMVISNVMSKIANDRLTLQMISSHLINDVMTTNS